MHPLCLCVSSFSTTKAQRTQRFHKPKRPICSRRRDMNFASSSFEDNEGNRQFSTDVSMLFSVCSAMFPMRVRSCRAKHCRQKAHALQGSSPSTRLPQTRSFCLYRNLEKRREPFTSRFPHEREGRKLETCHRTGRTGGNRTATLN